jgi:sugar transferase (PEP-CTERM/EpsH1 system associated)
MRILCLTARLPYPPNRGDRLRAYNYIRELSRQHELTLVSFIAHESEQAHAEELRRFCRDVRVVTKGRFASSFSAFVNLWRRQPLQALYYRSAEMNRLVESVLREGDFDAVYVHLFRMAPFIENLDGVYRVVDLTDVVSQEVSHSLPYRGPVWGLIYSLERPRIERYERHVADTFEETWLISEADRRILAAACPEANIQVVTNGVDVGRFHPTGVACEPNSLIFTGHLQVFHNVDAVTHLAEDVLPIIRQQLPDCTLNVVGASPSARVQRLAEGAGVTVTGFVEDLNDALNRSAVFVAPLRFAAGVQNKVLEAMAAGRPVVTTSIVNAGLGAAPGREVLVADDAQGLANHTVSLLRDRSLWERVSQAGMEFVRRRHSWNQVVERMAAIEASLSSTGPGGSAG